MTRAGREQFKSAEDDSLLQEEEIQIRIHGSANLPTLIYLPGLHGNWCLIGPLRRELDARVRFIETSYPATLTWSLDEHAQGFERILTRHGISSGWILAESFSSQVAWTILARRRFLVEGLILAGGFVRHPMRWAARLAQKWCDDASFSFLKWVLFGYARVARFRFRRAPETMSEIREFVAGLTPRDLQAAKHRLHLVAQNDLRPIAQKPAVAVYALSGLFDPVVPWPWVRRWMNQHCASLAEYKIIWHADHNVLGTAPKASAKKLLEWMSKRVDPAKI